MPHWTWVAGFIVLIPSVTHDFRPIKPDNSTTDIDTLLPGVAQVHEDPPPENQTVGVAQWLWQMTLTKWTRLYVKTGATSGRVVLVIQKVRPRDRVDHRWTYIRPDRSVSIIDTGKRDKVSARRIAGTDYEAFPALTAAEKRDAEEASRDAILGLTSGGYSARFRSLWQGLKWIQSGVSLWWLSSTFGTVGFGLFSIWKVANYMNIIEAARWSIEKVEEIAEGFEMTQTASHILYELIMDGSLESTIMWVGLAAGACYLLASFTPQFWGRRSKVRIHLDSDSGESDFGSDGEAGHSAPPSDSEGGEIAELKAIVAGLRADIINLGFRPSGATSPRTTRSSSQGRGESSSGLASDSETGEEIAEEALKLAVDAMIRRLGEYEKAISADRQRSTGPPGLQFNIATPTASQTAPRPTPVEASSTRATAGSGTIAPTSPPSKEWVDLSKLRDALDDPKAKLLSNLEKLSGDVDWKLPAGVTHRIAPGLLVKTYSRYGSFTRFGRSWVADKELERNHVAHEMMLHCMLLDKMLLSSPDFPTSEGCEMICRRVYGIKRAFREVRCSHDWKQPKGSGAAKWRTKVRWDLAAEIDWRALEEDDEDLPEIEHELQTRVKDKAILARYLAPGTNAVGEDED